MSCCVVGKQAAVQMFISVGLPLVHKLDEHGLDRLIEALVKAIGLQKMTHTYCSFDFIFFKTAYQYTIYGILHAFSLLPQEYIYCRILPGGDMPLSVGG